MKNNYRTGVLGGTFDPIHMGHLDVADAARRALDLETVLLIPSRIPPHRSTLPLASEAHRFAMVELAASTAEHLVACDIELTSSEQSYTSITLQRLTEKGLYSLNVFFIIGADAFAEITYWYDYPAVLNRSHFIVISRPGCSALNLREHLPMLAPRMRFLAAGSHIPQQTKGTAIWLIDEQTTDVSSSKIRKLLNAKQSVEDLVPEPVASYIDQQDLYSPKRNS
jgi:nicotinate-nucleotide adenylyltransferase